jgi:ParB/RepB/Spo0J family partition protein
MDAIVPPAQGFPVPITLIDDDGNDMRRAPATAIADTILESSIKRHGVLEPIGVRLVGNRYSIAFGRRRLRCATRAGLEEIPVHLGAWTDNEIRAVQAAENLHREATHPVDLWRTVCDLRDQGYSIEDAAAALCHTPREVKLLERLGRLDPELLKLAEMDMPRDHQLQVIANAPHKAQRAALKAYKPHKLSDGSMDVPWIAIAQACRVDRVTRTLAIFDADAHEDMWAEDLFAEPDDPDRFFTNDVPRFLRLQHAELKAQIKDQQTARQRVQIAEWDASRGTIKLPPGFRLVSSYVTEKTKPKRIECIFSVMKPDGQIHRFLAEDVAAKKAADKAAKVREQKQAASQAGTTQAATDDDDGPVGADAPPAEALDKPGISKAGLKIVADLKTEALRATLQDGLAELPLERVIVLLLLAFAADNVDLHVRLSAEQEEQAEGWGGLHRLRSIGDVIDSLLLPGGGLSDVNGADARALAGTLLGRILKIGGPDETGRSYTGASGDAAEWIGAAIGAGAALDRLDTVAFLATVGGDELRRAAESVGLPTSGTVKALRERLVGKLPDWRPAATQFGASAPTPRED